MKTNLAQPIRSGLFLSFLLTLFFGTTQTVLSQTVVTLTTADNGNTVTIPANATNVTVEVWGAGGSGAGGSKSGKNNQAGGGGGGGEYSRSIGIGPGTYSFQVGTGAPLGVDASNGSAGGNTSFDGGTVLANGGGGGIFNGAGGAGGTGGNWNDANIAGTNGSAINGTTGGDGGAGANGGAGGAGSSQGSGTAGSIPGGGGGGGSGNGQTGGAGADGQIVITYDIVAGPDCPDGTTVAPGGAQSICEGNAATQLTATISTSGGTGTPTLQYQWYYNTSNSNTVAGATLIAGATSNTYTPLTTTAEIGDRWYFCVGYATDNTCAQTNTDQALASNAVQVTVTGIAVQPGSITGPISAQPGTTGLVYSITAVPYATNYVWTVPTGWTITAGDGTTSITVTSGSEGQNGNITVAAENSCGTSTVSTLAVSVVSNNCPISTSVTPATQTVCQGDASTSLTASVTTSGGNGTPTINYQWYYNTTDSNTIAGAISVGNNSPTFDPPTNAPAAGDRYYFCVAWDTANGCGQSSTDQGLASNTALVSVVNTPSQPGAITGDTTPEPLASGITYSITPVATATSYTWSISPQGSWTIDSGQGSTSISVTVGAFGEDATISVTATNICGTSSARTLAVSPTFPDYPPTITLGAIAPICAGTSPALLPYTATTDNPNQYSITFDIQATNEGFIDVTNAVLPASPISINVPVGALGGTTYYADLTVTNTTSGLTSGTYLIAIPLITAPDATIYGQANVPPLATGYDYSVAPIPGATYSWTVPTGWIITEGNNSNYIRTTTGAVGQSGNISVTVTSPCGSDSQNFAVTVVDVTNHQYYNCTSCHFTHTAPGVTLTSVDGNALLCQSCHTSTGVASDKPLLDGNKATPGVSGQSHSWNVEAVNPNLQTNLPTNLKMLQRTPIGDSGNPEIICSTCHNQHNNAPDSPYLRISNAGDAMCKDCHSVRDVGIYAANPAVNKGSHPVGVAMNVVSDPRFQAPSKSQVVAGNVECSSCHGMHDIAGNVLTDDGYLLRDQNDDRICQDCHTYRTHQGFSCLTCHEVHNTVDGTIGNNIMMIRDEITTPNSGVKPVVFTAKSGANSFADGNNTFDGVCEVCHTATLHHRNDGSEPNPLHDDNFDKSGQNCAGCHNHADANEAFTAPELVSCIGCHSQTQGGGLIPQIVDTGGEMDINNRLSTHVGGATPQTPVEADCLQCHYEAVGDHPTTDMQLKDPDAAAVWSGDMDVYCVACHDGNPPAGLWTDISGVGGAYDKSAFIGGPHDFATNSCAQCHERHGSDFADLLKDSDNYRVCRNCHDGVISSINIDVADIAFPGVTGNSHAWDVNATNATLQVLPPLTSPMVDRMEGSNIVCSTCHQPHAGTAKLLAGANDSDQLCKDCHRPRDKGRYKDDIVNNKGSHPVGVAYTPGGNYVDPAPTLSSTQVGLVGGNVECSSCHAVHNATTTDGYLLRETLDNAGCKECHNYQPHQGFDCLDCHTVHNTTNIMLIRETVNGSTVVFDSEGTTASPSGQAALNSFSDGNATRDGICEVCHTTTLYHTGNADDGVDHNDGKSCVGCHPHRDSDTGISFPQGSCHDCHEEPGTPNQLYPLTGAHEAHAGSLYAYGCSTCHFGHGDGGANEGAHSNGVVNVVFDPNGLATRNGLDAITPTWDPGTKTCSNVYCHSNGMSADRGTDNNDPALGLGPDFDHDWAGGSTTPTIPFVGNPAIALTYEVTPAWDTGSFPTCIDACHKGPTGFPTSATNYDVTPGTSQEVALGQHPLSGSHGGFVGQHDGNGNINAWGAAVQCFWCHNTDTRLGEGGIKKQGTYGTAWHIDGAVHFKLGEFGNGTGGTFVAEIGTGKGRGVIGGHCNNQSCWD